MTQYPLVDLTRQFTQDVQAVSAAFQAKVSDVSREILERMPASFEAAQEPSASTPGKSSGSGAAAGKRRSAEPGATAASTETVQPTVQASPKPQVGLLAASPRKGGGLLDAMRARGTFFGGGASPAKMACAALAPSANVVAAKAERSSNDSGKDRSFDGDPGEAQRPEKEEKAMPPPPLSPATPGRAGMTEIVRVPKRPRENSVVALYKEMVEPHLDIGDKISTVTPLKANTLAKKFRRSSMLKQAASREIRQSPTPAASLCLHPALKQGAKLPAAQESSASSSSAIPGRAACMSPLASPASKKVPAASGSEGSGKRLMKKTGRPPVPAFSLESKELKTWQILRQTPLSPKHSEDNYEMSEKDENSDQEEEPDRSGKHVPRWCSEYLETLATQSTWDPESILGKVPACDLDSIFSLDIYKKCSRERPKRRRGSSGQWSKDRLRAVEIRDYKRKMGQTQPWNATLLKSAVSSTAAGSASA